ncbi:MAG: 4'-phosphopantetheinyl transferase family protein, partial [Verrucomicrobiota bacterium]
MSLPSGLPSDVAAPVVAVWCVDLAREPDPAGAVLPAADWERARRFLHPEARRRHTRARARLRRLLGAALGLEPADVPLVTGPRGKPRLDPSAGLPDLRFNLAHAGDRAALALAWAREVGIDLEPVAPGRDLGRIAARWFTAAEAERLRELGP